MFKSSTFKYWCLGFGLLLYIMPSQFEKYCGIRAPLKLLKEISTIWSLGHVWLAIGNWRFPWNLFDLKPKTCKLGNFANMYGSVSRILFFPTSKTFKNVHLSKDVRTFLSKILLLKSKTCKLQLSGNVSGILPLRLFLPRFSTLKESTFGIDMEVFCCLRSCLTYRGVKADSRLYTLVFPLNVVDCLILTSSIGF